MRTPEPGGEAAEGALILDRFFPYRLSVLQLAVSRALAQVYAERFGLHRHEWRVLAVLASQAPLSAGVVAARTSMGKVQVSRAVAGLRTGGLIDRAPDTEDRRRSHLRLSAAGRAVYREIVPRVKARERELLEVLDAEERRALDATLDRLIVRARDLLEETTK